ncbi:MAG: sensor histidine kinase [Candidatus Thorarchaeota archaeon]
MQATDIVLDFVLLFTFITFYGTIAWGLIRYSKRQGYRLWAIGWIVYTIGALQGGFASSASGLSPLDVIAMNAMYVGATLILDGTRTAELTRKRIQLYGIGIILFTSIVIAGLIFGLGFQYVFIPLGLHIIFVCIRASQTVSGFESIGDSSKWWFIGGMSIMALSWSIFPLTIFLFDIFQFFIIFQAVGVIITGSAMLTMFTKTVTKDLEVQYQISQIISGLVQHDIRNYIQTARHALELTESEDVVENHWINIATEVLIDAGHFVDEMRDISVSINQVKAPSDKVALADIVDKTKERVIKEYKLTEDQIQIQVQEDVMIENSRLIYEMLWNIFDNAFKHGSSSLSVHGTNSDSNGAELIISDRGKGLPEKIKAFLNSSDAISQEGSPLVGLGVLLVRGIATLCGISLYVSDNVEDISVPGTTYRLKFNGPQ